MARNKLKPTDGLGPKEIKAIRAAVRLVWQRSHARKLVVKRCTDKAGYTRCEKCKARCPALKVDHIQNVGDVNEGFITRMFVPSSKLTGMCGSCHAIKTALERARDKSTQYNDNGVKKGKKCRKARQSFMDQF